jgi:signal transduction histidine kinase
VEHGSTGDRARSDDPDGREDATSTVRVGAIDREGFYVEDDGPGISESERERVFETGYTTASAGTGFGLAIVEGIAEAHDWEVAVTSSGDGGARFEVTGVERVD